MPQDITHNGWTNYVTWLAYTWITNEEDTYKAAMRAEDEYALREMMQDIILGETPEHGCFTYDMANASLQDVDVGAVFKALHE